MSQIEKVDLKALLAGIKPSLVTPHLAEISQAKTNEKKLRLVSHLMVKQLTEAFNRSAKADIPRVIMHEGKATQVRRFNVEPLLSGVWPAMSLMLLQLSYGEQMTLIEALYPKATQFTAKCFAAAFTKLDDAQTSIEVKTDNQVQTKLDSANAGVAMIIAMLRDEGYKMPHPDHIKARGRDIQALVAAAEKEDSFKNATKRAQEAAQSRDL